MQIGGLEWHRWVFILLTWVPWLLITLWYVRRMKQRFRDDPDRFIPPDPPPEASDES